MTAPIVGRRRAMTNSHGIREFGAAPQESSVSAVAAAGRTTGVDVAVRGSATGREQIIAIAEARQIRTGSSSHYIDAWD